MTSIECNLTTYISKSLTHPIIQPSKIQKYILATTSAQNNKYSFILLELNVNGVNCDGKSKNMINYIFFFK